VDGKIHPEGFVQQGGDSASLVTAYAALRPRDGFSHPHQEHMKDTYIIYDKIRYNHLSISVKSIVQYTLVCSKDCFTIKQIKCSYKRQ